VNRYMGSLFLQKSVVSDMVKKLIIFGTQMFIIIIEMSATVPCPESDKYCLQLDHLSDCQRLKIENALWSPFNVRHDYLIMTVINKPSMDLKML
jgi:hypothetical protein